MKRLLLALAVICPSLEAAPPGWWSAPDTKIIEDGATPNNSGPVNQGQLKNVAKKAALYLNNTLPGAGAGVQVNAMVEGFVNDPATAFAPVNLGQLKAVAKPFYDRLIEVGFETEISLQSHNASGAPVWSEPYPWLPGTPHSANLAPANIGQLKWVFSFDFEGFSAGDADADQLPAAWEEAYGFLMNNSDQNSNGISDGLDDFDGDGLCNADELQQGTNPNELDNPLLQLQVSVTLQ